MGSRSTVFYQVGGFRGHIRDSSNDRLASRLMGRDGAEFILGICPNGASYLLLTEDYVGSHLSYMVPYRSHENLRKPHEFVSLSPIHFATQTELVAKLNMYNSNKKTKNGPPVDRSKANTQYTSGRETGLTTVGAARSSFEHQRMFYRLCQDAVPAPEDYALRLPPWFDEVQIYSFTFNLWTLDERSLDERLVDPQVLDIGWTKFDRPTDEDDLRAETTTHLNVKEKKVFNNRGKFRMALPGITEDMPFASITSLIQETFAPQSDGHSPCPIILLVYDNKMTRAVFNKFGVNTSRWTDGIRDILYHQAESGAHNRLSEDPRPFDRTGRRSTGRERSRSPRRNAPGDPRPVRTRSPLRRSPPPVYLVDVQHLYRTLIYTPCKEDTLLSNAKALCTSLVKPDDDPTLYEDGDVQRWCAGRDSRLLGYMWEEMANSGSIDEQRLLRNGYAAEDPSTYLNGRPGDGTYADGDVDPNDVIQPMGQNATAGSRSARPMGMFDSEDEDDY